METAGRIKKGKVLQFYDEKYFTRESRIRYNFSGMGSVPEFDGKRPKGEEKMNKRITALVLLLVLLSAPTAAWGETVQFETALQFYPAITAVKGTDYVIVADKLSGKRAVFNTKGDKLTPDLFTALSYIGYDFFIGTDDKEGVNTRAMVHVSGAQITEPVYGQLDAYNKHWFVAYVLSQATEDAHTYTRSKGEYFNVDRYDLYYVGDDYAPAQPIAALSPEEFASASVHGEYIAIEDKSGSITLYDKTFQPCGLEMEKTTSPVYGLKDYFVINQATGETVGEGYISVREAGVSDGLWLIVTRYDFKGDKVSAIIDTAGNQITDLINYTIYTVTDHYAVVVKNKLRGLYSLDENRLIVPCEFSGITASSVSADKYVQNGYVGVEKDKMRGYWDVNAGELSCEIKYPVKEVTTIGCSSFWKKEEGVYVIAAADGVETEVQADEIYSKTRGNGYLLVAKKGKLYGVIDWHGNEILPFEHSRLITITDDSGAVIRTSTGVQLDRILTEK